MVIGYARVFTDDQDTATQVAALTAAECERIFREKASRAPPGRDQLLWSRVCNSPLGHVLQPHPRCTPGLMVPAGKGENRRPTLTKNRARNPDP